MISIQILNYRTPELVLQLVDSIFRNCPRESFEILILDNGSGDNSEDILKSIESDNVKIFISQKNLGFGAGHNYLNNYSEKEFILMVNSDVLFLENSLKTLLGNYKYLSQKNKIGIIQPRVYRDKELKYVELSGASIPRFRDLLLENIPFLIKLFPKTYSKFRLTEWDRNSSRYIDTIYGSVMFCKNKDFRYIGRFDERFFLYFEEFDICGRFLKSGYKNYYTIDTSLIHLLSKSPIKSLKKQRIYLLSLIKYTLKNKSRFLGK